MRHAYVRWLCVLGGLLSACGLPPGANPETAPGSDETIATIGSIDEAVRFPWAAGARTLRVAILPHYYVDTVDPLLPYNTTIREAAFSAMGHDADTGSAKNYWSEVSEGRINIAGTVFPWFPVHTMNQSNVTRNRRSRYVWLHNPQCDGGGVSFAAVNKWVCKDPLQPAPGTMIGGRQQEWYWEVSGPNAPCPDGSATPVPVQPAAGVTPSDWCRMMVLVADDLIPTIKASAVSSVLTGISDSGAPVVGFREADYDLIMYVFPENIAGATHAAKVSWASASSRSYLWYNLTHEFGHFLGLNHYRDRTCRDLNGNGIVYAHSGAGSTNSLEYAPWSVMGGSDYRNQIDGFSKLASGAISSASLFTVNASGQYSLRPTTSVGGSKVLRILDGEYYDPPTNLLPQYYYLEWRSGAANTYDYGLPAGMQGVWLHAAASWDAQATAVGSHTCGPDCSDFPASYDYPDLLDGHPETTGDFTDAALKVGESYSDAIKGITVQVSSLSDPASIDVTFRPANTRLLYTPDAGGTGHTYTQFTAGGYTYVSSVNGFGASWTHIVGANNGAVLFYDSATGAAWTSYLDGANIYHSVGAVWGLAPGYTHVTSAGRGNLLFYNSATGAVVTGTVSPNGLFTSRGTATWQTGWTSVTGTLNGGLFIYRASDGRVVTATLDGAGGITNHHNSLPNLATGFTRVAACREDGLLLYNGTTGAVRTARVDDRRNLTLHDTDQWLTRYTSIAGGLNGSLLSYRASDGYTYTFTMDAGYQLHWVSVQTNPGTGFFVNSVGGY